MESSSIVYDIGIIGGGVVGCAVAREAAAECGLSVVVLERDADLLSQASGCNSGILCTGVDTTAPIERALIRDSNSRFRQVFQELNIPFRECGALVCDLKIASSSSQTNDDEASSHDSKTRLGEVLAESHMAGDTHAKLLDPEEVAGMEPNLAPTSGAVHIPGETVVDPWLSAIALAVHARQNGAVFHTSYEVKQLDYDDDDQHWTIRRHHATEETTSSKGNHITPTSVKSRVVVNAAGLWADTVLSELLAEQSTFKAQPRRGQYVVWNGIDGPGRPIQPIPTQFTKGIFVFSTLYDQVVVGPTAVDQESKTDRSVDEDVSEVLKDYCYSVLPQSRKTADIVGDYVGIRPATEHRDYQIRCDPAHRWLTVAGIRSTGLTASLGIGRHCLHLLTSTGLLEPARNDHKVTRPLPDVAELAREYRERGHQYVVLDGYDYRVTHPLTRWGWEAGKGLAAGS